MSKMCPFCEVGAGERKVVVRASSKDYVAFDSEKPRHQVHVVLIPRQHVRSVQDMTRLEFEHLLGYARRVANDLGIPSFRMLINVGVKSGQRVPHACVELFSDEVVP